MQKGPFIACLLLSLACLSAQSPLSDETAFEVMFREARHVEADAVNLEMKGASAADLRSRYRVLLSLDASADQAFRSVALACVAETEPLDARALRIISDIKAKYRPTYGSAVRAGAVPPIPAELVALQQQKTAAVRKWMDVLESRIGRGRMVLLAATVRRHVSSHSAVETPPKNTR